MSNIDKLERLLKALKDELVKGKIVSMHKPVPQMPQKPEPVQAKQIDKETRLRQMAQDPSFPSQRRAAALQSEQQAEHARAAAKNARQDADYKNKLQSYQESIKHWPLMVLHGDSVTGSVEGKQYSVKRSHPEHTGIEDSEMVEHAHEAKMPFRIKQGKTHRLTVKMQGGGPTKQIFVTPEQYKQAMVTGWHVDDGGGGGDAATATATFGDKE